MSQLQEFLAKHQWQSAFFPSTKFRYESLIRSLKTAQLQGMDALYPKVYCDDTGSLKDGSLIPPEHYRPQAPINPDYYKEILSEADVEAIKCGDYTKWSEVSWELPSGGTVVSSGSGMLLGVYSRRLYFLYISEPNILL